MSNDRTSNRHSAASAASAFVVHLTVDETEALGIVQGRVEHVMSGRWARFASTAEMIGFMRQTLQHEAEAELRDGDPRSCAPHQHSTKGGFQ